MRKLSCIVVDDEPLAIKLLENYILRTPSLAWVASFTDPVEALSFLRKNPVQLLFLDIEMPDMTGLELSRILEEDTKIIFTTAYREYALESYEVSALDFLLKPIHYSKFIAAVAKAERWFELLAYSSMPAEIAPTTASPGSDTPDTSLFVKVDGMLKRIDVEKLLYVCAMKDYVMFHLADEKRPLITHLTMKAVEEMLPAHRFMRVHRSYVVALDKIISVDRNDCIYIGEEVIHVTTAYVDAFKNYLASKLLTK